MAGELVKTWKAKGLQDIMNLTLVPFGNAKIDANGTVTCQHGPTECTGNSYEQCAISHNPESAKHVPFYFCLEASKGKPDFQTAAAKCATTAGLDIAPIETCVNGTAPCSTAYGQALLSGWD